MTRQNLQTIIEAKLQQFIEGIHIYNSTTKYGPAHQILVIIGTS